MKKTVWTFRLISGAIVSVMTLLTIPFADSIGFDHGEVIGYTTMVLAFLLVFFGVRSYRDNVAGGKARASGESPEVIQKKVANAQKFARLYQNPVINVAITFIEPLPVGLVFALVSAGILSRKRRSAQARLATSIG